MSFEDDEYWEEQYSDHSPVASAVAQDRYPDTYPAPMPPRSRTSHGQPARTSTWDGEIEPAIDLDAPPADELAARRRRRSGQPAARTGSDAPPARPQSDGFDSARPGWLDDPEFVPTDVSGPDLAGPDSEVLDVNRPELGANFDNPEYHPPAANLTSRRPPARPAPPRTPGPGSAFDGPDFADPDFVHGFGDGYDDDQYAADLAREAARHAGRPADGPAGRPVRPAGRAAGPRDAGRARPPRPADRVRFEEADETARRHDSRHDGSRPDAGWDEPGRMPSGRAEIEWADEDVYEGPIRPAGGRRGLRGRPPGDQAAQQSSAPPVATGRARVPVSPAAGPPQDEVLELYRPPRDRTPQQDERLDPAARYGQDDPAQARGGPDGVLPARRRPSPNRPAAPAAGRATPVPASVRSATSDQAAPPLGPDEEGPRRDDATPAAGAHQDATSPRWNQSTPAAGAHQDTTNPRWNHATPAARPHRDTTSPRWNEATPAAGLDQDTTGASWNQATPTPGAATPGLGQAPPFKSRPAPDAGRAVPATDAGWATPDGGRARPGTRSEQPAGRGVPERDGRAADGIAPATGPDAAVRSGWPAETDRAAEAARTPRPETGTPRPVNTAQPVVPRVISKAAPPAVPKVIRKADPPAVPRVIKVGPPAAPARVIPAPPPQAAAIRPADTAGPGTTSAPANQPAAVPPAHQPAVASTRPGPGAPLGNDQAVTSDSAREGRHQSQPTAPAARVLPPLPPADPADLRPAPLPAVPGLPRHAERIDGPAPIRPQRSTAHVDAALWSAPTPLAGTSTIAVDPAARPQQTQPWQPAAQPGHHQQHGPQQTEPLPAAPPQAPGQAAQPQFQAPPPAQPPGPLHLPEQSRSQRKPQARPTVPGPRSGGSASAPATTGSFPALENVAPIAKLATSGPDTAPRRYADAELGATWFTAKKPADPGQSPAGATTSAGSDRPSGPGPGQADGPAATQEHTRQAGRLPEHGTAGRSDIPTFVQGTAAQDGASTSASQATAAHATAGQGTAARHTAGHDAAAHATAMQSQAAARSRDGVVRAVVAPTAPITHQASPVEPRRATPGQTAPELATPGQATSEQAVPGRATPGHGVSGEALPGVDTGGLDDQGAVVLDFDITGLLDGTGVTSEHSVVVPRTRESDGRDPDGPDLALMPGPEPVEAAPPVRPIKPLSAEDLEAIRWRLDGGTLREVVDDRDALRELGDRLDQPLAEEQDNVKRSGLLSVRAEVYRLLGELGMAAAASRLALAYAESAADVQAIVIAQAELAHVLRLRGDFTEADRLFEEAASSDSAEVLRSVVHENAGRSCFDQGRHMEALNHFARAVRLGDPEDTDLVERVGVCLEAVYIHVLRDGWGPYPRLRREILGPVRGSAPNAASTAARPDPPEARER